MNLQASVVQAASRVRDKLDDDQWLRFSRLCQMHRYELNQLLAAQISPNPITYIRIAAALESVGMKTRLSELDDATKAVMMALGLTPFGEFKDFFEKHHDRVGVTKYVCEGARLSELVHGRVKALAKKIRSGRQISPKGKIDLADADSLRLALKTPSAPHAPEPVLTPAAAAPAPAVVTAATRSMKIADSVVSMFNSIANIASVGIDGGLPDEAKLHIAFTTGQLFKKLGIDAATLDRIRRQQEQHSGHVSDLANVLFQGSKTK